MARTYQNARKITSCKATLNKWSIIHFYENYVTNLLVHWSCMFKTSVKDGLQLWMQEWTSRILRPCINLYTNFHLSGKTCEL